MCADGGFSVTDVDRGHDSGVRSLFTTRPGLTSDQYTYRKTLKQRAVALEHLVCGM